MPTDQGVLFLLTILFGFLWAALQMTGSKLLGFITMILCLESLWLVFQPTPEIFWWGFAGILIFCGFYGWWIYEPATAALSPQISSTNHSVGVAGNNNTVVYNQVPPERPKRTEPSIPSLSLETRNALVVSLRDLIAPHGGQLKVAVVPTTRASYPFARALTTIFESAGWEAEFRDPPRGYFTPMNRGMGVTGANTDIVMAVRGILVAAGCTGVNAVSQQMRQGTPPPGWNDDQHFIHIEVSYRR